MNTGRAVVYAFTRPMDTGGHVRLVNRTTLDLIKALRQSGYEVVIEPNDGSALHYLVEKGEPSLLANPTFVYLIGIPTSVIVNLFSSWLYRRFQRQRSEQSEPSSIVFRVDDGDTSLFYSHTGREVPRENAEAVLRMLADSAAAITAVRLSKPAKPGSFPLCLEHTTEIVGEVHLQLDPKGLRVRAQIDDDRAWQLLKTGDLKGLSIAGIATHSECSICGHDYTDCTHIAGVEYDGRVCTNAIKQFDLAEVSLVREPVNQEWLIDAASQRRL